MVKLLAQVFQFCCITQHGLICSLQYFSYTNILWHYLFPLTSLHLTMSGGISSLIQLSCIDDISWCNDMFQCLCQSFLLMLVFQFSPPPLHKNLQQTKHIIIVPGKKSLAEYLNYVTNMKHSEQNTSK